MSWRQRGALVAFGASLIACAAKEPAKPAAAPAPAPPPTLVSPEPVPSPTGITALPGYTGEGHLDDDTEANGANPTVAVRSRRRLEMMLRSTPSGALAAVDGIKVGRTPVYWEGDFTGSAREFTFVLPGHALARYRFVPITSGLVHARLTQISAEDAAAGRLPEIPTFKAPPVPTPRPRPVAPTPTPVPAPSLPLNPAPTVPVESISPTKVPLPGPAPDLFAPPTPTPTTPAPTPPPTP